MELEFSLLPKQIQYIDSTADTAIFQGGVGAAKTVADVCLALDYAFRYPGIDILMTAPTYGNLKDTVIREFQEHCPQEVIDKQTWGIYPEVRFVKHKNRQSRVRFRSFDKPWKPKGITCGLWIGGEMTETLEKAHGELRRRVRQRGMPNHKRFTTNPDTKRHWFYTTYIEPWENGTVPKDQVDVIHTTSFDNYLLPDNYIADLKRLELNRPGEYRRMVLGEWGEFDENIIGAFQTIGQFTAQYLVAFLDTSFSDSRKSDRTALSIVGFVPDKAHRQNYWHIQFTGKAWQKSITDTEVIHEMVKFLHQYKPIAVRVESQLGDSTQVFIDRFKQAEKELNLSPKNHWSVFHQTKNKHERIMLHVAGNKDRLYVVDGTDKDYLNPVIGYHKGVDHEDEIDSLAGAIDFWQTSPELKNFIYAAERLRASGARG